MIDKTSVGSNARILVLNDFDPRESAGAASVSANLAGFLQSENMLFLFAATTKKRSNALINGQEPFFLVTEKHFEQTLKRIRNRFQLIDSLLRLFSPFYLLWLYRLIGRNRIDIVWIHQIGHRFSYLNILICRLLKLKVVVTIHDYSLLRFRKLYPHDLALSPEAVESALFAFHLGKPSPKQFVLFQPPNWQQKMTRFFFRLSHNLVYVSSLQQRIYHDNGFPIGKVVENITEACTCDMEQSAKVSPGSINILFAGRMIGKGLERISSEILSNSRAHLHLAGRDELRKFATCVLPLDRFTYHGFLNARELARLIHEMDFVSVLSDCFDVYPTVTLESVAHGTPTITSLTTGTFGHLYKLSPSLALSRDSKIDLENLLKLSYDPEFKEKFYSLREYFTNIQSLEPYREILLNKAK